MKENNGIQKHMLQFEKREATKSSEILEQTSGYLRDQIKSLIKSELKAFRIRSNLAFEIQQHRKQQKEKELAKSISSEKLKIFKEKQKNILIKKYQTFLQKQKDKQNKLDIYKAQKNNQHYQKFQNINLGNESVKQKFTALNNDDKNQRLSKLSYFDDSSIKFSKSLSKASYSRSIHTSNNEKHRQIMKQRQIQRQTNLVNQYLKKISVFQEKSLRKQVQMYHQREETLKKKVKCLIQQRQKNEDNLMTNAEKQYKNRMEAFNNNYSRLKFIQKNMLMARSAINETTKSMVLKKREQLHEIQINRTIQNFTNKRSLQNSIHQDNYSKRNLHKNIKKMKEQKLNHKLQNQMKFIYFEMQKLKNLKYGQKLDDVTIQNILSMMDKKDPDFNMISEFLKSERKNYIEGIIKKEEQKNKFDKNKKQMKNGNRNGIQ